MPDLKVEDGLVFKKTKVELEIGEEYIWKLWIIYNISAIIEDSHCNTAVHGGLAKTLERVKRFFYWAKMAYQVREKVKSCQICKEVKPANQNLMPRIGKEVRTGRPFQKLYIDFLGKYPISINDNFYVLSKFTFLKAMREEVV